MTDTTKLETTLRAGLDHLGEGIERNYSDNSSATGWFIDDNDFPDLATHLTRAGFVDRDDVLKIGERLHNSVRRGERYDSPREYKRGWDDAVSWYNYDVKVLTKVSP